MKRQTSLYGKRYCKRKIEVMPRIAFKMKLFEGCEEEYKKRHDAIWPELKIFIERSWCGGLFDFFWMRALTFYLEY